MPVSLEWVHFLTKTEKFYGHTGLKLVYLLGCQRKTLFCKKSRFLSSDGMFEIVCVRADPRLF